MLQSIIDIAEICSAKGVARAVISPGSRNAPLTLAFARHAKIETFVIPDERSAGFIALGMAQKLQEPVVLICTSGSAVYNYAPAIAEAYYSQIPLLVLSADRPPEWIDQRDGQTIRQNRIFGEHVKKSFTFPETGAHPDQLWHCHRMINEAINLAQTGNPGPVHINIPLREPFYPRQKESFSPSPDIKIIDLAHSTPSLTSEDQVEMERLFGQSKKVLIVAGQGQSDQATFDALEQLSTKRHIPVITDIISNYGTLTNAIIHQDLFLGDEEETLRPDLLITFGKSVISKKLKLFLRKNKPLAHCHINPVGSAPDTFQSLTKVITTEPADFFKSISLNPSSDSQTFLQSWKSADQNTHQQLMTFMESGRHWELSAVFEVLKNLPQNSQLHLANSMPVRWANFIGTRRKDISVFTNRGTSGIDGCLSTAVGCALSTEDPVVTILGDMSFLYDRNGLWHNHLPKNLRIIVLNNHGGGIFRLIDGPSEQPELEHYFETDQKLTCENTIKDFDIEYLFVSKKEDLTSHLNTFFKQDGQAKLIEVMTDSKENKQLMGELKSRLT